MKLNWGHKILILYLSFVGMIVLFIVKCMQQNIDLVAADYYDREINYQAKFELMENAAALPSPLTIRYDKGSGNIKLSFPRIQDNYPSGNIHFFKPDDASADFDVPVQVTKDYQQFIPTKELQPGIWNVEVTWHADEMGYFSEERLLIN